MRWVSDFVNTRRPSSLTLIKRSCREPRLPDIVLRGRLARAELLRRFWQGPVHDVAAAVAGVTLLLGEAAVLSPDAVPDPTAKSHN
jgi:hypothetical protein